nr:MAG TPA: hypothetical protein [Caudoviricetes sp.]
MRRPAYDEGSLPELLRRTPRRRGGPALHYTRLYSEETCL